MSEHSNDQCKGDKVKGFEVRWKSYWSPNTGGKEPDKQEKVVGYKKGLKLRYEGNAFLSTFSLPGIVSKVQ